MGVSRSLRVDEVCERFGVARGTGYAIIRELNGELEEMGYRTASTKGPGR